MAAKGTKIFRAFFLANRKHVDTNFLKFRGLNLLHIH